jgi:hypothetical protein
MTFVPARGASSTEERAAITMPNAVGSVSTPASSALLPSTDCR